MLGFLSTFIPPSARPGFGAAPDGAVDSGDLQTTSKIEKTRDNPNFQTAFAKANQGRPEVAGASNGLTVDESLARGESDSAEQAHVETETGDSQESSHSDEEETAFGSFREGDPDAELAENEQGDTTVYAAMDKRPSEPASGPVFQDAAPDNVATSADADTHRDGALVQDASLRVLINPNNSGADMGRAIDNGAYQPPFAGTSVNGLRVQSVLLADSVAGAHGASSLQAQGAPIDESLYKQDQTALVDMPVSARDGQAIVGAATATGGAIMSLASGGATSKDPPLSDGYSATKDAGMRVAMVTATDMMRNAVSVPPEPVVATLAAGLGEGEEGGRSMVSLTEPVISGEARPSSAMTTELRMSAMSGGSTPQMARHVAIQISEAVGKAAERSIDLTLNPSELGRVRITLTPGDGGMVVSVIAERPETLDLMRRHIDVLDQEFLDLGYGATDFSFTKEESEAGHAGKEKSGDLSLTEDFLDSDTDHSPSRSASVVITDRLDIRL